MAQRSTTHYSVFLERWAALVGIPSARITDEIAEVANVGFQNAIEEMWDDAPWLEVSPYGEARFLGNRLSYPNDLTKTAYWTATSATLTANSVSNPADGTQTATKVMEVAAVAQHGVQQTVTNFYPQTGYAASFYARPNGRVWQYIEVYDGAQTYTAFFNTQTGAVGSYTNFTSVTMGQQPNGFWVCKGTFTTGTTTTTSGYVRLRLSTDGATLSYLGDITLGSFFWGALLQQTTNTPVQDLILPWSQLGEAEIDAIFNVWPCSPFANNYPSQFGYNLLPQGAQIINGTPYQYQQYVNGVAQNNLYGAPPNNPLYIYYRKVCPNYSGPVYDATDTYAIDDQIYFVNSAGVGDFYKALAVTTAGQSPETNATLWEVIPIYTVFLQYSLYSAFSDWLISDGQVDKAMQMKGTAEDKKGTEFDKQQRQMDCLSPMIVTNHLTSRPAY